MPEPEDQMPAVGNPLEMANEMIRQAMMEKSRLMAMLCILVQKNQNSAVITFAELNDLDSNTELLQTNPTEIGFVLSTRIAPPLQ